MSQTMYIGILLPIGLLAAIGCGLLWRSIFRDER